MALPLESVRERLLRAGISPRQASRYVTELREHLADLTERERRSGLDATQAAASARRLLGDDAQLAQKMIDSGAPRSWAARAPWVLALLPVALYLMGFVAIALSMMHLLLPVKGLAPSSMPVGYRELIASVSFVVSYLFGPMLAAGILVVALRQRLVTGWTWAGLCLIALLSACLGFHMHAVPAADGHEATAVFSAADAVYLDGQVSRLATLMWAALRTAMFIAISAIVYRTLHARLQVGAADESEFRA